MSPVHDELLAIVQELATASEREVVRTAIGRATALLDRVPAGPEDQRHVAHAVAFAANYTYLLGDAEGSRQLLDLADERLDGPAAKLVLLTGRHRLYRNLYHLDDVLALQKRASTLAKGLDPTCGDVIEALLEESHLHRYQGHWDEAFEGYKRALDSIAARPHLRDIDRYRIILLLHYIFSLLCDAIEHLVVGSRYHRIPELGDYLAEVLRAFPTPNRLTQYPMAQALFEKHEALALAGMGRFSEAKELIRSAWERMVSLGSTKGRLLCEEFRALIDATTGELRCAVDTLESVAAQTRRYYPRATYRCSLHLARLRIMDGQRDLDTVLQAPQIHCEIDGRIARALHADLAAYQTVL